MKVRFTSAAELEIREALLYYEANQQGLATEFLAEVEAATDRITSHPHAWAAISPRTRRCRTHRFPYGIFYQIRNDEILIVSVMDLRRDPKRWEHFL
ncbi:MAG TPA: type II toxin-antitoxin system RelE/ParE family toxin [Verrucomicrobiae bacterium]|nr:type II toxin-antitoxin system RelE/ParE family toxin [Verrucomicrobiae bacterium]